MKTNNWREDIKNLVYMRPESLVDAERLYLEAQNIIQSLLDKQKEEIIEIVGSYKGDNCYASQNIINKIKEI